MVEILKVETTDVEPLKTFKRSNQKDKSLNTLGEKIVETQEAGLFLRMPDILI